MIPQGRPLRVEKKTNKLNPNMMLSVGIKPGPPLWEVSDLTSKAPLLKQY